MTEITQADRDAAARSFASDHDVPMDCAVCKAILSGEEDDQEIVTRFARHRKYGYDQGYYDGRQFDRMEERAAIVAWLRKLSGYDATTPTFQDRRLAYQLAALDFSNAIEAGEHLK